MLSELGSFPSTLLVVTAMKSILTDVCRKQHTVTLTQEDNNELPGNKTPGRYPIFKVTKISGARHSTYCRGPP